MCSGYRPKVGLESLYSLALCFKAMPGLVGLESLVPELQCPGLFKYMLKYIDCLVNTQGVFHIAP